jgi:uncharacterized protein (DUF1501 family)
MQQMHPTPMHVLVHLFRYKGPYGLLSLTHLPAQQAQETDAFSCPPGITSYKKVHKGGRFSKVHTSTAPYSRRSHYISAAAPFRRPQVDN